MRRDPEAISKLRREVAEIEARKVLSRKDVVAILCRQAGGIMCGCGCGEPLEPLTEGVIDEHRIALQLTGSNDLGNREFWRKPCSVEKTKGDLTGISKAKRIEARENGTRRERKPIVSAGFNKTITRGFDGKVRPRKGAK